MTQTQDKPILKNAPERIESINNNTDAIFNITDNPSADSSYGEWRVIEGLGIKPVNEYQLYIEEQAQAKGVDPDLVKAIIYIEHSQGYHANS